MLELIKTLCAPRGVTGDEKEIAALIADLAAPLADRVETDALGNVLAFKKGRSSAAFHWDASDTIELRNQ